MIGSVNALDATLAVVMAYFLIRGLFQGVVREVISVVAVVAAFFLASQYWAIGSEHLKGVTPNATHRAVISFFLTYCVIYFLINLTGIFVEKLLRLSVSAFTSSALGGAVGLLKGSVLAALTLLCATVFIGPETDFFAKSKAWPYAEPLSQMLKEAVPNNLRLLMDVKIPALAGSLAAPRSEETSEPAPLKLNPNDIDWSRVREILKEEPASIEPAWRIRFENIESETELSDLEIKQFVKDHPDLFAGPPDGGPEAGPARPAH